MKNGAVQISCRPMILTFSRAASSMISLILAKIAAFCEATGRSVGKTILFWIAPTFTSLWGRFCYFREFILKLLTSTSNSLAFLIVYCRSGTSGVLTP